MGYDFMLEKAASTEGVVFPCDFEDIEVVGDSFPWLDLKEFIILNGGNEHEFSMSGSDAINYDWEIPGQGTIFVSGSSGHVSLDMHAEWGALLDLLKWLSDRCSCVVLADTNTGEYHDAESFAEFMSDQKTG